MKDRRVPVQGVYGRPGDPKVVPPGTMAYTEYLEVYDAYAKRFGRDQDSERMIERGGFGKAEAEMILGRPLATWRELKKEDSEMQEPRQPSSLPTYSSQRTLPAQSGELPRQPKSGVNFGVALAAVKAGAKIARSGWNGKGMFVVYQKAYPDGIPINKNTAEATGIPEGTVMRFLPYLMMKTADGSFVPWLASQTDILADDWEISQ